MRGLRLWNLRFCGSQKNILFRRSHGLRPINLQIFRLCSSPRVFCSEIWNKINIAPKMSDIKSVICLLSKHLNLSIGLQFKPEYFRLAKFNKGDEEVIQALWTVLHILSNNAVKDQNIHIDFSRYDDIHATKLYFAFLQYPTINFYGLSKENLSCGRELLLALGWLISAKSVLNIAMRKKITQSALGHECSCIEDSSENNFNGASEKIMSLDSKSRMHNIAHTSGRLSHNIKEISELLNEKIKLTTKIHAATLNTCGLPHLSVFQAAITKKMMINEKNDLGMKDQEALRELKSIASLLETHKQWNKTEHIFYDWMVTVIEEGKNEKDFSTEEENLKELSHFLSLLRHVTKKKLHSLKSNETTKIIETSLNNESCVSRFFRTHKEDTEAELWSSKTAEQLTFIETDVRKKMSELESELRKMLESISNCVEI